MKFTGHERDLNNPDGTGDDLDYMHARYCSPLTAWFMSVDPAGSEKLTRPQTWNRYAYANNNPLKFLDPDGREAVVHEGGLVIDHGILSDSYIYWGQNAYEVAENYNRTSTVKGIFTTLMILIGVMSADDGGDTQDDPALPDEYWEKKRAPEQVEPGTRRLDENKPSSRSKGEVYERTSYYDEYGRNTGRTDRTDHGEPDVRPNPHHHRRNPETGERRRDPETGSRIWPGVHPDDEEEN